MNNIFLFAHQDDEYGVFHEIQKHSQAKCLYFTHSGNINEQRNKESVGVLTKLGIDKKNIYFPGDELKIEDLRLIDHFPEVVAWLRIYLMSNNIDSIYIPAWEGGHPDHDTLHAATMIAVKSIANQPKIYQYSLYNAYGCPKYFFKVFNPLSENGKVIAEKIPFKNRLRYLMHCLSYPSQWKTWVGLFPFVLLNYLVSGEQRLQEAVQKNSISKPHAGLLYYEARNFSTWSKIQNVLKSYFFEADEIK